MRVEDATSAHPSDDALVPEVAALRDDNAALRGNELRIELDEELQRMCDAMNQSIWQNALYEEADLIVASIASELGKKKLPVPTAKDVVTYAVQVDVAEDAIHQLARQLTPARRAAPRKRGML